MTPRDKMHRCPVCKKLYPDENCIPNENGELQCPNKCIPIFNPPKYELPTIDD